MSTAWCMAMRVLTAPAMIGRPTCCPGAGPHDPLLRERCAGDPAHKQVSLSGWCVCFGCHLVLHCDRTTVAVRGYKPRWLVIPQWCPLPVVLSLHLLHTPWYANHGPPAAEMPMALGTTLTSTASPGPAAAQP